MIRLQKLKLWNISPVIYLSTNFSSTMIVNNAEDDNNGSALEESQKEQQQAPSEPTSGTVNTIESIVTETLHKYFSFEGFRPLQQKAIIETMSGKNVMMSMGTGGGETLTFMLPAVLSLRLTLVVSLTLSLINDMVKRAVELNISTCLFTSEVPEEVKEEYLTHLEDYKLCYCTPEVVVSTQ